MKLCRTLALSAFALLAAHTADATTYYDTITGITNSSSDQAMVMANSFTAPAVSPDFTAVQLLLSVNDGTTTGAADVYVAADDNGSPSTTTSQLIGSVSDDSLPDDSSAAVVTFFMSPTVTSADHRYW